MSKVAAASPSRSRDDALRIGVPAVLLALASLGWWWSVRMAGAMDGSTAGMSSMDSMPGDEVLSLGAFLVAWLAMMTAMMFPAISPVVRLYGRAAAAGRVAPLPVFVAGYIIVWTSVGLPAYFGWRALMEPVADGEAWAGRFAGVVLIAAAVWQVTPLKAVCLRHCRSPMSFFMRFGGSVTRPLGALRMGASHGLYCVGCCWALFALLVLVGLSSLPWMGLITLIVCAEKLLPRGRAVTLGVAGILVALGVLALARPELLAPTMG